MDFIPQVSWEMSQEQLLQTSDDSPMAIQRIRLQIGSGSIL